MAIVQPLDKIFQVLSLWIFSNDKYVHSVSNERTCAIKVNVIIFIACFVCLLFVFILFVCLFVVVVVF